MINRRLKLLRAFDDGRIDATDYRNLVLKITVGNGEQYAIDMTGAQFGWTEAILHWNFYSASRIRPTAEGEKVMSFGQTKTNLREFCLKAGRERERTYKIYEDFGKVLDGLFAQIEADGILPKISALVRLPEVDFKAQQEELLYTVRHHLERVKALFEEQGSLKIAGYCGGLDRELKPWFQMSV